jgi:hypothetical protein
MAKDIFTLEKDGAKRHQLRLRRINFQFSIFNSGLSGLGVLQVQKEKLDYLYLRRGAIHMEVATLLGQAIKDAGGAES